MALIKIMNGMTPNCKFEVKPTIDIFEPAFSSSIEIMLSEIDLYKL